MFLDAGTQLATARQFLVISGAVALGVCLAVLLLALLFSGRAVRPIAQSVEKQRQFITDAGHELKTPLTIISANCEVLEMEMEKNEWLTGIEKQVARLRKLVNDLVALSRLDEGRPMGEEARFSLSDAVCDTALAFSAAAERAGKRLRVEAEPGVFVTGDEAALRQLTAILVDNAVKATEAAGVTPLRVPIRGGTDGAQLSWEGLPCPNLGTGGYAFHGPYEHITVEGMDKCVEIIRRIVEIYA